MRSSRHAPWTGKIILISTLFLTVRDIIEVVTELDMDESAIIVNDQLGRGRTTRTLVIIKLLQDWLRSGGKPAAPRSTRPSYTVINNLLRVIKNGFEVSASTLHLRPPYPH